MHYDMSKLPGVRESDKKFMLGSAWAGFDDVVAIVTGKHALDDMRRVIDSARGGKGTWHPTAAMTASIARAKAAKETFWTHIDLASVMKAMPTPPAQPTPIAAIDAAFGASPHSIWMRLEIPKAAAGIVQ
jgi:hypothetical protein